MTKKEEYFKRVTDQLDEIEQTSELTDEEKLEIYDDLEDEVNERFNAVDELIRAEEDDEDEDEEEEEESEAT